MTGEESTPGEHRMKSIKSARNRARELCGRGRERFIASADQDTRREAGGTSEKNRRKTRCMLRYRDCRAEKSNVKSGDVHCD